MKNKSPVIVALLSLLVYAAIATLIYYLAYGSLPAGSMLTVILVTGVVGAMPLLVNFRYAGFIFYAGCIVGFLVDSLFVRSLSPAEPAMPSAGWWLIAIMAAGLIVGMITEVVNMRTRFAAGQDDLPEVEGEYPEEEEPDATGDPGYEKYDD